MIAKSKRLILSVCLAAVMAVSFVVGVFLMLLPYGAAAEGARHKLELSQDLRAKAEGISYDVSFEFASSGWFVNSVPTTEDITMSWTSTAEEAATRSWGASTTTAARRCM